MDGGQAQAMGRTSLRRTLPSLPQSLASPAPCSSAGGNFRAALSPGAPRERPLPKSALRVHWAYLEPGPNLLTASHTIRLPWQHHPAAPGGPIGACGLFRAFPKVETGTRLGMGKGRARILSPAPPRPLRAQVASPAPGRWAGEQSLPAG